MFFKTFRPAETALSPPKNTAYAPSFPLFTGNGPSCGRAFPGSRPRPPAEAFYRRSGRPPFPAKRRGNRGNGFDRALRHSQTFDPAERSSFRPRAAVPQVRRRPGRPAPPLRAKKTARSPGKARRHLLRRKTIRAMPSARSRSPRRSAWRRVCVRTARPASSRGVPRPNGSHRASSPRQNACP